MLWRWRSRYFSLGDFLWHFLSTRAELIKLYSSRLEEIFSFTFNKINQTGGKDDFKTSRRYTSDIHYWLSNITNTFGYQNILLSFGFDFIQPFLAPRYSYILSVYLRLNEWTLRKDLPAILCTALSAIVAGLFVPERLRALPSGVDGLDMVLANVQLHQKTTSPTKRQKTLDLSDLRATLYRWTESFLRPVKFKTTIRTWATRR